MIFLDIFIIGVASALLTLVTAKLVRLGDNLEQMKRENESLLQHVSDLESILEAEQEAKK